MEMSDYRERLDELDDEILRLFVERMDIAAEIGAWKKENGLPVLDAQREEEKLRSVEEKSPGELRAYSRMLFSLIMELSRDRQNRILQG